ncbi:MAG TPA: hypothetical protein VII56_23225 [Rhizomicrobium sp.]
MTAVAERAGNPERRFYMAMILAMIATVLLGFARSFFLRPLFPGVPSPPETFFYVHGVLFVAWMALLLTQGSLISLRNTALHMRLGVVAYVLVPAMIAFGVVGSVIAARRPGGFVGVPVAPLQFLTVVLGDMAMFALFAGLALVWRRTPQTHKRFILLACIVLMDPSIGRWPVAFIADIPDASFWLKILLFLVPLAIWDVATLKRLHPATLIGGTILIAEGLLRGPLGATPQWLAFAKWAVGL